MKINVYNNAKNMYVVQYVKVIIIINQKNVGQNDYQKCNVIERNRKNS